MDKLVEKLINIVPHERQIKWQETEFYAFIHYGVNQFTGREWGTGEEEAVIFNPQALDTDQWCEAIVSAGMKGAIITAKHHDGFCLWDTAYTKHSVMYSPYKQDIVGRLSNSCKKYGLKYGVYLSPWDRHDKRYGQGQAYNDYFCNQLTELLTKYGDVFSVWFDGACGEGSNGKVQVYDWQRYYALIRKLQPEAVISVCGPDVRWCGNEAGHCRVSEWSVVAASMMDNEAIKENSQQEDLAIFRERIPSDNEDLGSREVLKDVASYVWYPAEVNTSIRPGWFYHANEDDKIRSLAELSSIYLQSVGGNATFLLNIPPHPDGYFAASDVQRLKEIGQWIKDSFSVNLLAEAIYTASSFEEGHAASALSSKNKYWKAVDDDSDIAVIAAAKEAITPHYLVLQEEIRKSQRIEAFTLSYWDGEDWKQVAKGSVVGYKRICPISQKVTAKKWKLEIPSARGGATLKTFELY